jgi:hypothetical protein
MEEGKKIYIASIALGKGIDYEELYYSDYMHGREDYTDDVWEYVVEGFENGLN